MASREQRLVPRHCLQWAGEKGDALGFCFVVYARREE